MKFKLLLLTFLLPQLLVAAEESVSVHFRAIAPELAPLTPSVSKNGKEIFIEIPEGILSSVQEYRGPAKTVFRDVAGQRLFPVSFPKSSKLLLVILYLDAEGQPASMVVDDDIDAAPAGSLSLINISNETLRAETGEEAATLEPGERKIIEATGKRTVFVRIMQPSTGRILFSNNWAVASDSRTLAILGSGKAESAGVRVYRFSNTPAAKK